MISLMYFNFAAKFLKRVFNTWCSHSTSVLSIIWLLTPSHQQTAPVKVAIDLSVIIPNGCFQSLPITSQHHSALLTTPSLSSSLLQLNVFLIFQDLLVTPSLSPLQLLCLLCSFLLLHQAMKYQNSQLFILALPHFLLCVFCLGQWLLNVPASGETHGEP